VYKITLRYWPLIVILVASLVPFLWFWPGLLITGTDVDFPPFPTERLIHRLQTWDSHFLGGTDRSNNVASLPFVAVNAILEQMGFGMQMVEKLSFVFWLALIGGSMYFLMSVILGSKKGYGAGLAKVSAALLYMFGFYNVFLWVRLQLSVTTLIIIPVFLGLLIAVYRGRISLPVALAVMVLMTILCGPTGIQPPLVFILFIFTAGYLVFHLVTQWFAGIRHRILRDTAVYASFVIAYIVGSAFWLLPLINFVLASGYGNSAVGMEVYEVHTLLEWLGSTTSMLNVMRFFGDMAWFNGWGGEPYFPEFILFKTSSLMLVASMIIPLIVFAGLLFVRGRHRLYILFFSMVALLGLFLSKGLHSPAGGIYLWLVENVPFFWIQRAPWQKFAAMSAVSYAVLFGLVVGYIAPLLVRKAKNMVRRQGVPYVEPWIPVSLGVVVIVFLTSYHWIFVSGKMFSFPEGQTGYHEKYRLGFHHRFPDYLFPARNFVNNQRDHFKLFFLPDERVSVYKWGFSGSTDVSTLFFEKGLIHRAYGEGIVPPNTMDAMQDLVAQEIYNRPSDTVTRLLGLLNVKYVIQRNDFRYNFFEGRDSPAFIQERLAQITDLTRVRQFGQWDLYEVPAIYRVPQVYVPSQVVNIGTPGFTDSQESLDELLQVIAQPTFNSSHAIYVAPKSTMKSDILSVQDIPKISTASNIEVRRIAATKYRVRVRAAQGVMPLVLSESFHADWKAYIIPHTKRLGRLSAPHVIPSVAVEGERQSTQQEIEDFIARGWVTNVSEDDGRSASFISSRRHRSIQNDNLADGSLAETWFANTWSDRYKARGLLQLPDSTHVVANGYANSWLIDTAAICQNPVYCQSLPEGGYDLEIVLEFWPQRLFYSGAIISGGAGLIAISFLAWAGWRTRRITVVSQLT
jgi:hypothetical protein